MAKHRRSRAYLISVAAGAACLAFATPAWAAADPHGANGTVKIDGVPLDRGIDNEPHDGCEFEVAFFDFDKDERVNIVFAVHSPTGQGAELLRRDGVLASDDPAGGGKPDPDESYIFSASDLGLDAYTPHEKQGFHIKLTVERLSAPGAGKHKVFWLKPCEAAPGSPPSSSTPGSPPAGGGNGGSAGGRGLPVTGTAVGSIALLGGAMIVGGTALLLIRRRRDIAGAD